MEKQSWVVHFGMITCMDEKPSQCNLDLSVSLHTILDLFELRLHSDNRDIYLPPVHET
jgi:hypothetical protein